MATKTFDANSWEFLQRVIRINHNRNVKKYFKDIERDGKTNSGRAVIKTALLIRDNDSAIEVLNKQIYFNNLNQGTQAIVAYPEDFRLRAETKRKQLIVIFKPTKKEVRDKHYPISVPHYAGSKTPKIKSYYKGNYWARIVLKDNSQIHINGRTKTEAINMAKNMLRLTDKKYRVGFDEIKTGEYLGNRFKVLEMSPYRADFFSQGKENAYPDWQHFF